MAIKTLDVPPVSFRNITSFQFGQMEAFITIYYHKNDLPADVKLEGDIAVDTEAMGLINRRDRLCVVQLSTGNGDAHLVHFDKGNYAAPNLKKILTREDTTKLFHFARFDVAIMFYYLEILVQPVYCTRTASKLVRTFTDRHGFKDLCKELLGFDVSKQQQTSDWGADTLTQDQQQYAANDVLYLHALREKLDVMLTREGRTEIANACFRFLPARALLDLQGWENEDIFAH